MLEESSCLGEISCMGGSHAWGDLMLGDFAHFRLVHRTSQVSTSSNPVVLNMWVETL